MTNRFNKLIGCAFLLFSLLNFTVAQNLPASRRVDWSSAGYGGNTPSYPEVSITNFGADKTGNNACNNAISSVLQYFNGAPGTIHFPAGTYFFNQSISLPANIILEGEGATQTQLLFNLNGANNDLIRIEGSADVTTTNFVQNAPRACSTIVVENAAAFTPGDYIKISQNDAGLVTSAWAQGCIGQIVQIKSINGNAIELESALRKSYTLAEEPKITLMNMQMGNGIECLKIKRLDATVGQTSNIAMRYAAMCWVKGVESDSSNYAHICLENSSNIQMTSSYFHGAFGYGGNGQGYGIVLQGTSGECLVENNVFKRLRHSMLLQAGANGNVLAYNYSIQTYWTDVTLLPADAAGDMVLHGNWPYANLFEGNIGQNMTIDNSHGKNGPFNTFFRNRGCNYGFFMNDGAGDSTNIIGNEITHPTNGLYLVTGSGNYAFGNNIKGIVMPLFTTNLTYTSLYRTAAPAYFNGQTFPSVGLPNTIGSGTIPAASSYSAGTPARCVADNNSLVILPVTLRSFTAVASGNYVTIEWQATDDTDDKYVVEKSVDGKDFTTIANVAAKGGTTRENTYNLITWQPLAATWYRLKMVNKDGSTTYSKIIMIARKESQQESFIVISNPVHQLLSIRYNATAAAVASMCITDVTGKTILQKKVQLDSGTNSISENVQALSAGIYYIRFYNAIGQSLSDAKKIMKL